MRYQWVVAAFSAAGLSLAAPSPASAESAWNAADTRSAALKWELGYLALSAVDAGQTIHCLDRGICEEGNPVFGRHPSAKKLIIAKVGLGALHFVAFKALNDRNPRAALRLAQVSCAVQGGVAMLNARFMF
jgi:hypothetical protein